MVKPEGQAPDASTELRILEAADRVFLRRGTHGARMAEIAEEAGVNKALLHYYYRGKERLAEAVFLRMMRQLLPAVVEIMAGDLPLEEKAARTIERYIDQLSLHPYLPGYVIGEITHHPDRLPQLVAGLAGGRFEELVLGKLEAQIAARVAAGTLAPISARQFLTNVLSLAIFPFALRPMLQAVLGLDAQGFERFVAERRDGLAAFVARGLRP